jgi:DNA-binding transcriptional regulator YhcF (GntR family)
MMDFQPNKGIFLQIADSIIEKILNDEYPIGSKIPSVRELAGKTGVNPNTIVRSYSELQSRNIIDNKRGVGFFVNSEAKKVIQKKKREQFFNEILPEFVKQANLLNISLEEITDQMAAQSRENS